MTSARDLLRSVRGQVSRPDAEFLLQSLLHCRRHELFDPSGRVPARIGRRFLDLCRRCRSGEPPQYLVRSAPFLDLDLYVDRRVLIPRPETEELLLRALQRVRSPKLAVDFGTGSGCIAIALARARPGCRVVAVDYSARALAVARRNIARYRLARRIRLLRSSTLTSSFLRSRSTHADLIVANPPYIPSGRISHLSRRVRLHEPRQALDGGAKGISIVAMLLEQGPLLLKHRGLLALEIDHTHAAFVRAACPAAVIETDVHGRVRYAFLTRATQR